MNEIARVPEIGVAIPTLNSGATLDWTLLSLRHQTGCRVPIVVADSGSEDDTLAVCQRWNVPTVHIPPGNMYRAINAALRTLSTPWLTYLNSDDLVFPDAYGRLIAQAERVGADVAYGRCDFIDVQGRYLYDMRVAPPARIGSLFRCGIMPFSQPAAVFRRSVFDELQGFSESGRLVSDFDFFLRAHCAGRRFTKVHGPSVTAFRLHTLQISHIEREVVQREMALVMQDRGVRRRFWDAANTWVWRLGNVDRYLARVLRTGSLRSR